MEILNKKYLKLLPRLSIIKRSIILFAKDHLYVMYKSCQTVTVSSKITPCAMRETSFQSLLLIFRIFVLGGISLTGSCCSVCSVIKCLLSGTFPPLSARLYLSICPRVCSSADTSHVLLCLSLPLHPCLSLSLSGLNWWQVGMLKLSWQRRLTASCWALNTSVRDKVGAHTLTSFDKPVFETIKIMLLK